MAETSVPEIRFRPSPDAYAKAAKVAEALGLSVADVARIGFQQIANQRQINIAPPEQAPASKAPGSLRDIPILGGTVGRMADVARAAGRAAYETHVKAGRLDPAKDAGAER